MNKKAKPKLNLYLKICNIKHIELTENRKKKNILYTNEDRFIFRFSYTASVLMWISLKLTEGFSEGAAFIIFSEISEYLSFSSIANN